MLSPMNAEQLAQLFHETYERLAPDFGYRTREASAKPWADVPEGNRALMIATCAEVLAAIGEEAAIAGPDVTSPDHDSVYLDVRDGQLTMTQTTGRTLTVAVNGEFVAVPDRVRATIELTSRSAGEPDRGEGEWDAHDRAEHNAQLQAHRDEYGPEVEAGPIRIAEFHDPIRYVGSSPTLTEVITNAYADAHRMDLMPRTFTEALLARMAKAGFDVHPKYAPTTPGATLYAYRREVGWTHARTVPLRVIVSESREHLELLHMPGATIDVYDGDEPTILFEAWVPPGFIAHRERRQAGERP